MVLKILMLIFILLVFITAWYLIKSKNKGQFIIFIFIGNKKINTLFSVTSLVLILTGIIGIIILFTLPKVFNFITLIIAALAISIFSVTFMNLNE
ncbi:hypothetical protein FD18_GL001164 [Lactobacillus taiwanensis DSM 21401]|uniref:DUF3784 domain-containing protein n=1 Tax=Lactobacillus taiwanensis TaxID=508451 RepID=A0A256LI57_9LACO|nr:hypothetical protein [Lactobacillus taiwanensis]KRM98200.1 hypothetical protein FD18_GL001164 [Lactobacillus taiwanensis DSM 21401]OYR91188.1 hypothetical protein CBF59_07050 [Lactobacillus taiwanensis]OYR92152.1 hypothetical protein CBF70_03790 [Lactobacillus taiwanensis]OYR94306.1 hypothetical protein CBF58_09295 [Lactobacillus taiwanensis]